MIVRPGVPYPLGACFDGSGTNFAVFSEVASAIELCLFDQAGAEQRVPLTQRSGPVFHGHLEGVAPGQRYGFRAHAPYDPTNGLRGDPSKLLLDPYARAIEGRVQWSESVFSQPLSVGRTSGDSAPFVPRSLVVDPTFDWGDDRPPRTRWDDTVLYEAHVRGLTKLHPDVPEALRGTYAGLAHPAMLAHYAALGVTAIELLPVHHFVHDHRLVQLGLRNYWGYNTVGFFAPHGEYSSAGDGGAQVREFKAMVRALHAAGIEVILDVVYNHTGESDDLGPTLCFRGFDNAAYYRLAETRERYADYTGCGNSLNTRHSYALQLVMDSLRYWVEEMHVDGFRFDLASTLARGQHEVEPHAAFFALVQQDPVLRQVKLIAEPWDVGEGGYQVGNFPAIWSEWNGPYRDAVRDFWRGAEQTLGEFAFRFTGSSDLYARSGRRPSASINFVTCHDGFTLRDLVSYQEKHNLGNREHNRDGESHNRSWHCGVEGETDDPQVLALRAQQVRNLLTTLLLSQGVPMLLAGDELGRTQQGNNNAYCQDNEVSWVSWAAPDEGLSAFCRELLRLRQQHPVFRRGDWFEGAKEHEAHLSDIGWFKLDGEPMSDHDWHVPFARSLGVFLNGEALPTAEPYADPARDDSFYLFFNAGDAPVNYVIPAELGEVPWQLRIDTERGFVEGSTTPVGVPLIIAAHTLHVHQRPVAKP
ncbi:MAG: glycogen debranching protein GlgX [Polyangiales bacterium]